MSPENLYQQLKDTLVAYVEDWPDGPRIAYKAKMGRDVYAIGTLLTHDVLKRGMFDMRQSFVGSFWQLCDFSPEAMAIGKNWEDDLKVRFIGQQ